MMRNDDDGYTENDNQHSGHDAEDDYNDHEHDDEHDDDYTVLILPTRCR
jgi:hypothetical protein